MTTNDRLVSLCVLVLAGLMLAGSVLIAAEGEQDEQIDMDRARELMRKRRSGQELTEEERAYLQKAMEARRRAGGGQEQPGRQRGDRGQQRQGGERPPARGGRMTPRPTTGLVPLTELTAKYKGQDGGLYGGGKNTPPKAHLEAAMKAAGQVKPLDTEGNPAEGGKVVMVSIGMSNTTQEFSQFMRILRSEKNLSPALVVIDGAQGGMDSLAWLGLRKSRRQPRDTWAYVEQQLKKAGATSKQVQVVWIKQAMMGPAGYGEFPDHAKTLSEHIGKISVEAKKRYPNLRLAYLSSRIYAGYATGPLNPEPYAYESAFSVRWIIQKQIEGDKGLNCDPGKGDVIAPVLLWGPYLWGDGETPRKADKLVWTRKDLAGDGTHPSTSGRAKVAKMLLEFFKTDQTAKGWFLKAS